MGRAVGRAGDDVGEGRAGALATMTAMPEASSSPLSGERVVQGAEAVTGRRPTGRAPFVERRLFVLEEQIEELHLRLRERTESEQMHDLELRSMQLEIDLKNAYVARLETDQGALHAEIGRLNADRANLFRALEETRHQLAEVGALAASIQSQLSYRLLLRVVRLAKFVAFPLRLVRRLVRRIRHR